MILEELIHRLSFEVRGQSDLERANRAIEETRTRVTGMQAALAGFVGGVAAGLTQQITRAVRGLVSSIPQATQELDRLVKASDRIGIPIERLQALGHAASLSGGSVEGLSSSLEQMQSRLAEAARGQGRAATAFEAYGLSAVDAAGNVKTADNMLLELADTFQRLGSAERLELRRKLGLGTAEITMLSKGRAELERLAEEAHTLGLVFGEDSARAAEEFNDNISRMQSMMGALRTSIALRVMPTLNRWIEGIVRWRVANKEIIDQRIERVLTIIGRVMAGAASSAKILAGGLSSVARAFNDMFQTNAMGMAVAGGVGVALGGRAAFRWLARFFPVVAMFLVLEDYGAYLEGRDSVIGPIIEKMGELREQFAVGDIAGAISGLADAFRSLSIEMQAVVGIGLMYFVGRLLLLGKAATGVALAIGVGATGAGLVAALVALTAIQWPKITRDFEAFSATMSEVSRSIRGAILRIVNAAWDNLQSRFDGFADWAERFDERMQGIARSIRSTVNSIVGAIRDALRATEQHHQQQQDQIGSEAQQLQQRSRGRPSNDALQRALEDRARRYREEQEGEGSVHFGFHNPPLVRDLREELKKNVRQAGQLETALSRLRSAIMSILGGVVGGGGGGSFSGGGGGGGGGGGWGDAATSLGFGSDSPATGAYADIGPRIMNDLMRDFGLTREQAAGIVGNLAHETGGFKHMQEINPLGGGRGGLGWAQWTGPRRKEFEAYLKKHGLTADSYAGNYGFMTQGEPGEWSRALAAVREQQDVTGATRAFERTYERAGVKNYASRTKFAQQALGFDAGSGARLQNVSYANQGAVRSQKLEPELERQISEAVARVYGEGYRAEVYSGGQPGKGQGGKRVGSTRHDHGGAADIYIYDPKGKRLSGDRLGPIAQEWLATQRGGVGLEMKGGGVHLDLHKDRAPTWTYGALTPGQKAAVQAGLAGQRPAARGPDVMTAGLGGVSDRTASAAALGRSMTSRQAGGGGGVNINAPVTVNQNVTGETAPGEAAKAVERAVTNAGQRASDLARQRPAPDVINYLGDGTGPLPSPAGS